MRGVTTGRSDRLSDRPDARCSELVLRNYDHGRAYRVTVEVRAAETGGTTTETHRLGPGEIRCPADVAPRGATRVTARLASGANDAVDGTLGDRPDQTALVEVGNGAVSVSRGL